MPTHPGKTQPDPIMDAIAGPPAETGAEEAIRPDRQTPPGGIGTQVLEEQQLNSDVVLRAGADLDNAISTLTGNRSENDVANIFRRVADRLSGGRGVEGGEA